MADEREKRIIAQDKELQTLRGQIEEARSQSARIEADRDHARKDLEALRAALASERETGKQLAGELDTVRVRCEKAESQSGRLEADLEQVRNDLDAAQGKLRQETAARAETEKTLAALRIEAATLTERAAHVDELRAVLKTLQEQQGRAEDTGKARATPKRRGKTEG